MIRIRKRVEENMDTYLGFDFGGTKLLIGEMDDTGRLLRSKRYATGCTDQEQAADRLLSCAEDYCNTVGFDGKVQAAGVGIVGVSDHKKGEWVSMNHVKTGAPIPLTQMLSSKLGIPAAIDNDVRSATIAEWKLGCGKHSENFIYINVGTGLAAGFVVNGMLIRGANNNSGEVGHHVIDMESDQACICGRRGCAENEISGRGLARQAQKYGLTDVLMPDRPDCANAQKLFQMAEAGEKRAIAITERAADALAVVIMNLVRVTDPDMVILGGGVVSDGWLLEKAKSRLNPAAMRGVTKGLMLSRFAPENAGVIGAASLGLVLSKEMDK